MMSKRTFFALLGALLLLATLPALAWNPLGLNSGAPLRWDSSSPVVWNPDGGALGKLGNADATLMVADAFTTWQAVPTSALAFGQGGQIVDPGSGSPTDVTSANYSDVVNANNGQNPIIYDNDRDIFDMLGTPSGVLGFAGVLRTSGATITKGYAVLQGDWYDDELQGSAPSDPGETSEAGFRGMMVHEFGHFLGLGHTEVNRGLGGGLPGCSAPTPIHFTTMSPFSHDDAQSLHHDDEVGVSVLYPTAAFSADFATIEGHLIDRDGSTAFAGANIVLRPDTAICGALYLEAQGMQSGASPAEHGGAGSFSFAGLDPNSDFTVLATVIKAGGSYPIAPPASLGGPEDYYNGASEDWFNPPDQPSSKAAISSGAAGASVSNIDIGINNAGKPAEVPDDATDGLMVSVFDGSTPLDPEDFILDDGHSESATGYAGTTQMAWINRFTPEASQLPLQIERIDIMFWHDSAPAGRAIRLLVYTDPSGSGNPANSTLVYTEDTSIQLLSNTEFNEYTLSAPVSLSAGDFYVGAYDLVQDEETNFIATYDADTAEGRSWRNVNSTAPATYTQDTDKTWMIRAQASTVPPAGSARLSWGAPCNDAEVPDQDFAVYEGTLASLPSSPDHAPVTCSTGRARSETLMSSGDLYWLVSPVLATKEGSAGDSSNGAPRVATSTCETVDPDPCP